jgi:hypothetical protein
MTAHMPLGKCLSHVPGHHQATKAVQTLKGTLQNPKQQLDIEVVCIYDAICHRVTRETAHQNKSIGASPSIVIDATISARFTLLASKISTK